MKIVHDIIGRPPGSAPDYLGQQFFVGRGGGQGPLGPPPPWIRAWIYPSGYVVDWPGIYRLIIKGPREMIEWKPKVCFCCCLAYSEGALDILPSFYREYLFLQYSGSHVVPPMSSICISKVSVKNIMMFNRIRAADLPWYYQTDFPLPDHSKGTPTTCLSAVNVDVPGPVFLFVWLWVST